MMARQPYYHFPHTPEPSLYDTDSSCSSDEEMPDREETDQLLRQAHHYVITEGGKDSPSTYMERIQRINEDLVQEISAHSYDCDTKLFRRVKHKIDHVLREFEDAVDADSSLYDYSDSPEYYATAAEESLYRMDSSPITPEGPSTRRIVRVGGTDDVDRVYLYGGPGNHPESWYKTAAASLAFPETIRMADEESLRIDRDLAARGNMEKTEPVTGNDVPFNGPRLTHPNGLSRFESGSRFKLPTPDPSYINKVKEFASAHQLQKAVKTFYESDKSKVSGENGADGEYKDAPRVFLERPDMGRQISPASNTVDQLRSAVNTTPTKPRSISNSSSKVRSASPATCAMLKDTHSRPMSTSVDCSISVDDSLPLITSSPVSKMSHPKGTARTSTCRRIKAKTEGSIRSPNTLSSAPAYWETKPATHIAIPKTNRSRPCKSATSPAAATATYQGTKTGKRKRPSTNCVEDQTAEEFRYEADLSRRKKLKQDSVRPCTPTLPVENDEACYGIANTPATLPDMTPGSSVMSTPPVVKARTAAKKMRRTTKRDMEQRVSLETYNGIMAKRTSSVIAAAANITRGSTRSGKVRKL